MQQTWQISGIAANWQLTVTILPPHHGCCDNELPTPDLEPLAEHFRVLTEMVEAHHELDRLAAL